MSEDVKTELLTISAKKIPKHFFETEWEIPRKLDVNAIHLGDYTPSFSHQNEMIVNPVTNWDIPIRYGFELYDLESALRWFLSELQAVEYYGVSKPKLKIKFELNLGEIWIVLIDETSGRELASYVRSAEAVTTRLSSMCLSGLAEYDELYDLSVLVHGEIRVKGSYVMAKYESKDFSNLKTIKSSIVEEKVRRPSLMSDLTYRQLITGEKAVVSNLLTIFMNGQTKERMGELSDAELAFLLQSRGKKMLPASINGLRYIGEGQPRLVLDGYVVPFDGETATKEANLAEVIFGKPRDLTKTITYEEIFETLSGANSLANDNVARLEAKERTNLDENKLKERVENYEFAQFASVRWIELNKAEQRKCIDDYKQRMRQLNYRLGAMFGLGEHKALVSVNAGIAVNHRLL